MAINKQATNSKQVTVWDKLDWKSNRITETIFHILCQEVDFKKGIITLGLCIKTYNANNWKYKLHHCSCLSFILLYNSDSRPASAEDFIWIFNNYLCCNHGWVSERANCIQYQSLKEQHSLTLVNICRISITEYLSIYRISVSKRHLLDTWCWCSKNSYNGNYTLKKNLLFNTIEVRSGRKLWDYVIHREHYRWGNHTKRQP